MLKSCSCLKCHLKEKRGETGMVGFDLHKLNGLGGVKVEEKQRKRKKGKRAGNREEASR